MKAKKSSINFSKNNHILWLSLTGDALVQGTITCIEDVVTKFKIENYLEAIENVKDLKLALETASIASNRLSNRQKKLLLKCLLKNYNYEDLKNHKLFENYTINQDKTAIIHKSYESEIEFKFEPISFQNPLDRIHYNCNAQKNIFFIAVAEKNIQIMEKIATDLLHTAPVVSKLLKTELYYQQYLRFLQEIVIFIKPEKQLEVIKNLINTITIDLIALAHFSAILNNAKEYEAVTIILESTLLNPQLPNLVSAGEEKEALYRCRTNLWSAYVNTRNLASAEEQLLLMLKYKPNNSNFYNLFTIYRLNGKFTEAENLIQNASNDIKTLAKMVSNSNEISQSNLNLINQANLPDNCKGMLRIFQYMAKYNKYSTFEKISNKESLKDELIKISKSVNEPYTLAQAALKTKQYELAQHFLENVPQITLYLDTRVNNTFKELEFLLNPEKHSNQIHIENLTNKLHFSSDQATKIVDKVSIGLIADKKYNLALEKIDEVLKHDPQNQEVIERGLEIASLINNQEKIQQYSNLLLKDDNYEIPKEWDPIEIHKYYQLRKEQDLFHTIQQINRQQEIIPNSIWHIAKEHDITTNDVFPLGKYRGLDCYGKISKKLQEKLDKNQCDKFVNALKKGIIYRQQGDNGVKFIGKKVVEIKIDGDQRLFTNILHSNEHGELLINFDHQGNHNDVVKFAGEHHLEFHQDLL